MATVVVLGGGISGLSCAYYLSKLGKSAVKRVILYEKSFHLGGWIKTTRLPDGTIFEHGPRSLRPTGKSGHNTLALAEDLGLAPAVLKVLRNQPAAQKRFILYNNTLHVLPSGKLDLFRATPPFRRALIWSGLQDFLSRKKIIEDESCHDFVCRRLGKEVADYIMDPLCRGVVAGDAKEISIRSAFPSLYWGEQKYGSIIKGEIKQNKEMKLDNSSEYSHLAARAKLEKWAIWSLRDGLQQLPETLIKNLGSDGLVRSHLNTTFRKMRHMDGRMLLSGEDEEIEADHVFCCIPSKALSKIVSSQYPVLARHLSQISAVHLATVNLEYPGKQLRHEGFGFLVPSSQSCNVLGIVFDSCCFPEHDGRYGPKTRITCMMGGKWFKDLFGDVDSANHDLILKMAIEAAREHLGIKLSPTRHYTVVLKNCIPQYYMGHHSVLKEIDAEIKKEGLNISLIGASYHGVSVNDCIYNARLAVEKYLQTVL